MVERREFKRSPCRVDIDFSVSVLDFHELKRLALNGTGTDISSAGLGIQGENILILQPGHVLRFNDHIGHEAGIVIWAMKTGEQHRFGVRFV